MKEIKTPKELKYAAAIQNTVMDLAEARMLLGYMDGHGYSLYAEADKTHRLDNEAGGNPDEESEYEAYSISELIDFCCDMNAELIDECEDPARLRILWRDERMLGKLWIRAKRVKQTAA